MAQTFEDWAEYFRSLTNDQLIGRYRRRSKEDDNSERALKDELDRRQIDWLDEPAPADTASDLAVIGWIVVLAFFISIICWLSINSYQWLDGQGYIAHAVDSTIVMRDNWLSGESRDCLSEPLNFEAARYLSRPSYYALSRVTCDDGGSPHDIEIKFYGREIQPDAKGVEWRCTRDDSGFTCKETGTVRR